MSIVLAAAALAGLLGLGGAGGGVEGLMAAKAKAKATAKATAKAKAARGVTVREGPSLAKDLLDTSVTIRTPEGHMLAAQSTVAGTRFAHTVPNGTNGSAATTWRIRATSQPGIYRIENLGGGELKVLGLDRKTGRAALYDRDN